MSVEYANRSWVTKQAPLLFGCLIASGACERRGQNTRGVVGTSGAEGLGEVAAGAHDAAPETFPPEEPRLPPVRGAARHYPGADDSGAMPNEHVLALGAQGTVFVSKRPEDKIYALVDDDGDHKVDRVHSVARRLDISNWITHGAGASSNTEMISRMLGIDGFEARLDRLPKPVVVITDELPAREHHGWRYVRFGAGGWLYVTVRVHHQA